MTKLTDLRYSDVSNKPRHRAIEALAIFAYDNNMPLESVECFEGKPLDGRVSFVCKLNPNPDTYTESNFWDWDSPSFCAGYSLHPRS